MGDDRSEKNVRSHAKWDASRSFAVTRKEIVISFGDVELVEQQIGPGGRPAGGLSEESDTESCEREEPEEPRSFDARLCGQREGVKEHG